MQKKINTNLAKIYIIDNFLDTKTCYYLINCIRKNNKPSELTYKKEPDKDFRTSKTCHLDQNLDFIKKLETELSNYIGIELERSETIQGQYYDIGDQFKAHTDYFQPKTNEWEEYAKKMGQRTWTLMIYLNDVEEGGETEFPKLGINFKPKMGRAVLWNNLYPDGTPNTYTEHRGTPIKKGNKFIITKWYRTRGSLNSPLIPKSLQVSIF